ncbi:MAG: aryl-sulfate sulfotransferase [Deltaproteobacteria bacterium]|nr:aryl-sulfate sulfotransferase [Deltaproteobacteria bacterium]
MKNKLLFIAVVFLLSVLPISLVYAVEAFRADTTNGVKTELVYWDKTKAFEGYTLFQPRQTHESVALVYLLDMAGSVVHTWPSGQNPKLLEDGHLLARFVELDWDGNQVFRGSGAHHDTWKIYNKKLKEYTYIGLTREQNYTTKENVIAAGGDPSSDYNGAYCDGLIEIDKNAKEIWRWRFLDHCIQARDPKAPNYVGKGKTVADYPGKLDIDWVTDQSRVNGDGTPGVIKDWQHTNALDYNEKLDHIAINAKHWSEFYIVDHGATFVPNDPEKSIELAASDAGDFIYRFGNPSAYKQGKPTGDKDEGDYQMYGCHNIEWIDDGLPGAGNMTIYDNGCYNPMGTTSSLIELNPFLDANKKNTGRYVNPPDAGYDRDNRSNQVVWHFETFNGKSFYSHNVSSTQRLPNGNTLACAGAEAHIFEVTRDGEVVWEYINPLDRSGLTTLLTGRGGSVFRAYRYGVDYPAFKGKTLKPRGTISEILANVEIPAFVDGKGKGKKSGGQKGGGKKGGAKEEEEPREGRFLPY